MLWKNNDMLSSDTLLKYLVKLFHNSMHARMHSFVSVEKWKIIGHTMMKTSSSISGLHYRHYKAQISSLLISTAKFHLVNLVVKSITPLERWKRGVSVMLEKAPGIFLVDNFRVLLLLETYFNALHKINFNGRLMNCLETSSATPQEIIGSRRS